MNPKQYVQQILSLANVRINGSRPWDIQVKDERVYHRVVTQGSLGLGESYMDGWWDCQALDQLFEKIIAVDLDRKISYSADLAIKFIKSVILNNQRRSKAFEIGRKHYDIGNDLYQNMLDKHMTYTCGYWNDAKSLDQAQEAKLDLVCKKIGLTSEMRVLDIGCGWGSFAKFAAKKYKVEVVGITVSVEQVALARERCKGLSVEIRLQDYRTVNEQFDRIVSLGMFEHVGYKNYQTYMQVAHRCLKDDGLFLLHTIGGNRSVKFSDPWISKYIFPGSMLPSVTQIGKAIEELFVMEDWHNFGADYDKTLMAWFKNVDKNWSKLKDHYDERFYRMWKYYLLGCAGAFRVRRHQLWQIVLSKKGVPGGYVSIR